MGLGFVVCVFNLSLFNLLDVMVFVIDISVYGVCIDIGFNGELIEIYVVCKVYLNQCNICQCVVYNGFEDVGIVVVDFYVCFLYYVIVFGEVMCYGVVVGQVGKNFQGNVIISCKVVWFSWMFIVNMVCIMFDLYGLLKNGFGGGVDNLLGLCVLYLYQGGCDMMYCIYGMMDLFLIGKVILVGCIWMFNQDVMDLFNEILNGMCVKVCMQVESIQFEGLFVEMFNGYLEFVGGVQMVMVIQ